MEEGKGKAEFSGCDVGSPDLISIPGEVERMYEANVDDVGYRLVAIYTPVREDGVEGQPVSASTDPIAVEPDARKEVKQKLELGTVKFEVIAILDKLKNDKEVVEGQEEEDYDSSDLPDDDEDPDEGIIYVD